MKIYESKHTITQRNKKNFLDIPIAFVDKDYHPSNILINFNQDFTMNTKKRIVPYQEFQSSNFLVFDNENNKKNIELNYDDNRYTYLPEHIEFTPDNFSVQLLLKRKNIFSNLRTYNLNIGVIDSENGEKYAQKLVTLFGDASYYNAAPPNVIANNRNLDPNSFIVNQYNNLDFVFMEGNENNLTLQNLNYENIFETPNNIWILLNDEEALRYFVEVEENYNMSFNDNLQIPYAYDQIISYKNYSYRAALDNDISDLENLHYKNITKEIFHSLSLAPFIIYEKPKSGHIIISPQKILDNPRNNYQIIYNTLMAIYLRSYKLSSKLSSWITDEQVLRIGTPYNVYNKNHEELKMSDFLNNEEQYLYDIEYPIISNDNVRFIGKKDNQLFFKTIDKTNPEIPFGYISMKTHRQSIIYLNNDNDLYLIEPQVKIQSSIVNDKCYITIYPFVSSSKQIIINDIHEFQIKNIYKKWYLIALPIQDNNESDIFLLSEDDYDMQSLKYFTVAEISIDFSGQTIISDIRIKGGGLPLNYTNYDMVDIGVTEGKPYRIGVGGIIKLPKKYEKYDEKIRAAISTYKVAADRFYVIYT